MKKILLALGAISALSACSVRECKLEGAYLEAREVGALVNPLGGELPSRDPAYDIPPIPDQTLKAQRSYTTAAGEQKSDCLDRPPLLPPGSDA